MSVGITAGNIFGEHLVSVTFDVASVAAATSVQQTVTVPGLKVNDFVIVANATHTAGLVYGVCVPVTVANQVSITIANVTAGALDPASQTLTLMVVRPTNGRFEPMVSD